jgi:glycosyltransferase involved in cell wall biosynthesis
MGSEALRVAMFSDSAFPILNGVSVSIDSLVRELRAMGHSVTLFTSAFHRHRDADANVYRFFALETPWTRGYPLAIPPFYPWLRAFRAGRFDVIHTHTPFTVGLVGLRWGESHGIPVVSTYHTLYDKYVHYIPFFPKYYLRYKIAKHTNWYYNAVDQVLTPSEASARWLRRHSVKKPIHVVPTGCTRYPAPERSETRARLQVNPDQRVLLYCGRIAREKNMETLLRGVAVAMREDPRATMWVVGDGPDRQACAETSRTLGIGDRVRFIGFVPRDQVDAYYAAADLFVFASVTETQGLVVSEAMSYGLPAVVVQGGGASGAVVDGETGLLVRNNAEEFGRAVLRLLADDALHARMAVAARRSTIGATPRESAENVLAVYQSVLRPAPLQALVI